MSSVAQSSSPPSSSTPAGATASVAPTDSSSAHASAPPSSSVGDTRTVPTTTIPQPPSAGAATLDHSSPSSSGEHKFSNGSSVSGTASGSKSKRVFVFQKRWLHSLPIMEKTLPESADVKKKRNADEATGASSSTSSPTGSSATVNDSGESSRDVIACMLCDEPGSTSHHLTRVWSRMNCRRGRIENHLMSKHPEFMLLLKHKRDTEGDLSVQLFLQGMRDGRCNIRSEINLGLYNHIQTLNAHANADTSSSALASLTSAGFSASNNVSSSSTDTIVVASTGDLTHLQQSAKRGFPGANVYTIRDGGLTTNGSDKMLSVFPPLGGAAKTALEFLELENRNKRARLEAAPSSEPSFPVSSDGASTIKDQNGPLPSGATGCEGATQNEFPVSATAPTLEASVFTQWQSVFYNKLVVVTGGENEFITSLATNLWLLGANVLLTFTNITALGEFMTRHVARFPDADTSSSATGVASRRGVMLSMLCAFHTRRQIDEWSKSVADKYSRVDFLINFVDEEDEKKKKTGPSTAQGQQLDSQQSDSQQQQLVEDGGSAGEYLVSSANRLLELCQSISKLCFQSSGAGSIINITTQSDGVRRSMNCAAVESMTKSLALELQPLNVQVNCILLQQISSTTTTADVSEFEQQQQPQDQQNAALSHTILFLLSPASASVSGSVLRLQHRAMSSQPQPTVEAAGGANTPTPVVSIQTADSSTATSDSEARSSAAQVEQQVLI